MVLKSNFQNLPRTIEKTRFYNQRGVAFQYGLKHQLMRYIKHDYDSWVAAINKQPAH
jgi:hypothetical protein